MNTNINIVSIDVHIKVTTNKEINMKRILIVMLVISIALFSGCSNKNVKPDEAIAKPSPKPTKTVEKEKVEDDNIIDKNDDIVDAVTTPSIVDNGEALIKALGVNGTWIAATLNDIEVDKDIIVEGEFENKGVLGRKIALYTQDEDRNIIDSFSLTAPKLIIRSENTKLQEGTFIGDIYVESDGFDLSNAKIQGDLYFASQSERNSAMLDDEQNVSGDIVILD
jgi:hypothetical protein